MKITGEYRIDASQSAVWAAVNDPRILQRCIPGCEEIVQETPTDWTAKVTTKVGPLRARFAGRIKLDDLDPPHGCTIRGEGSGGAAGFASGSAIVRLTADGEATILTYEADTQIGGKLAQIGSRLVDSFARQYADTFFANFARIVSGEVTVPDAESDAGAQAAPTSAAIAPAQAVTAPALVAHSSPRSGWLDAQSFTILVLATLLVFMTVMYATKP